MFKHL